MIRYGLAVLGFAALPWSQPPAHAQQLDQEPLRIVRQIYAPYIANRTNVPGALALLKPHAAPELRRLIDREDACVRRSGGGICALDYDVIVDGQDFEIRGLQVAAADARPGAMTARASFRNFGKPRVVDFSFALTAGEWRLTDIVIRDGNRRLSTILKANR